MDVNTDIRLSYPSSNMPPYKWAELTITDRDSGIRIAEIRLDEKQLFDLFSGLGAQGVVGDFIGESYYKNIGRQYVFKKIELPDDRFKWENEVTTEMETFGVNEMVAAGFTSYRWTKHNYGWGLGISNYMDKEPEA